MAKDEVTPIRKQYLEIKRQYPDAILFFRLGDFYETFDQDAEITSRELDIVLTSRNVAKGTRIPMAGIPHHAAENYLARLIERGYHVAICEQVGEQPVKGIFPRKVMRVITPGTVVEPGLPPGDGNNYLVSVVLDAGASRAPVGADRAGVAYVDITTGEFAVTELAAKDIHTALRGEIFRLNPAEILYPDTITLGDGLPGHPTPWPAWRFESGRCQEELLGHFGVASLDGFGMRDLSLGVQAAGAIVQYLTETQPAALTLLTRFRVYSLSEFMTLDAATRRNLELTKTLRGASTAGSLLGVLDHTLTPMGKRMLAQWVSKPLLDVDQIRQRQAGVATFFNDGLLRAEIRQMLKPYGDLERLANRVIGSTALPRDLVSIRHALARLPDLQGVLSGDALSLELVMSDVNLCTEELALLESALEEEPPATLQHIGVIRPGFSSELDGVVERSRHAREWIANLEQVERERAGIKSLKVGYNKVFGYYIEVTKANTDRVPEEYIRKQTLVNSERYITPELKEYETLVLNAEERIREIESRLFREVCTRLAGSAHRILATGRVLAQLDVLSSLAEVAVIGGYVCPEVIQEDVLEIREGRHPVVEKTLLAKRFVPNDVLFEEGERIRIITHAGQSTFMVEMVEMANILHHASPRSLLILDEIGRGTSTYDGVSIAWAVVEYIHNHPGLRSKTLFATHYHELTQLAELLPGVRNYNVAVSEADNQVVFLHKVVPGGADRSYGIHVGQLAGLPSPVVQRAGEILRQLEASSGKAVSIDPRAPQQLALFPDSNPLVDELDAMDINTLSPIEALNKLYEWKKRFVSDDHATE
jgi:DNA mismatch repair protein MutS